MTLLEVPPLSELPPPSWSTSQLRTLGRAIKNGTEDEHSGRGGPNYVDVLQYFDTLASATLVAIADLDWESLVHDRPPPLITARAKTIDTLRAKLRRDPRFPLQQVHDLAGVRFEAEMSLNEQDLVAMAICSAFGCPLSAIADLRTSPRSGYRAVHIKLELPHGRVEVQVRTHMQGAWANTYEAAADVLGRGIRYGELPRTEIDRDFVYRMQRLSVETGAVLEQLRQRFQDSGQATPAALLEHERRYTLALSEVEQRLRTLGRME